MSHIYQPVMIKHLLRNHGLASDIEIAKDISMQDPTQIEYYQNITNNMVGKVLRNHKIVEKNKREYVLNGGKSPIALVGVLLSQQVHF